MRASDELHAVESLRRVKVDVAALDTLLLELLARDDQDSKPDHAGAVTPNDPVHRNVVAIVRDIAQLEQIAARAANLAKHTISTSPVTRKTVGEPCQACREIVSVRKSFYCLTCYRAWRRTGGMDRVQFEAERRAAVTSVTQSSTSDDAGDTSVA